MLRQRFPLLCRPRLPQAPWQALSLPPEHMLWQDRHKDPSQHHAFAASADTAAAIESSAFSAETSWVLRLLRPKHSLRHQPYWPIRVDLERLSNNTHMARLIKLDH